MSDDTFRFTCPECSYKARIPERFNGMYIKCPGCHTNVKAVPGDQAAPSTGDTVTVHRVEAQAEPAPKTDGKFRFHCPDCGYRARMPVKYVGMAIKCPGCSKPQMARPDDDSPATGLTAAFVKPTPTREPGKFLFVCSSCGYRARLPDKYTDQFIKCPGCNSTQQAKPGDDSGPRTGDTVAISRVTRADEEPGIIRPPTVAVAPVAPVAAPAAERPAPPAPPPAAADRLDLGEPVAETAPAATSDRLDLGEPAVKAPASTAGLDLGGPGDLDLEAPATPAPAPVPPVPTPSAPSRKPSQPRLTSSSSDRAAPAVPADEAAMLAEMRQARKTGSAIRSAPPPVAAPAPEPVEEPPPAKTATALLVTFLVIAVVAAGGLGWMWRDTKARLDAEILANQGTEHGKTRTALVDMTTQRNTLSQQIKDKTEECIETSRRLTAAQKAADDEKAAAEGTEHGKTKATLAETAATLDTTKTALAASDEKVKQGEEARAKLQADLDQATAKVKAGEQQLVDAQAKAE